MRRMLLFLTLIALMSVMMVFSAVPAIAQNHQGDEDLEDEVGKVIEVGGGEECLLIEDSEDNTEIIRCADDQGNIDDFDF